MSDNEPDNIDSIMKKVEKLLLLAEDQANPHEAALAAAKATEMLQKYNLEVMWVDPTAPKFQPITEIRVTLRDDNDALVKEGQKPWVVDLASSIANANYCKTLHGRVSAIFIGAQDNVVLCSFLFSQLFHKLLHMVEYAVANYTAEYKQLTGGGNAWLARGASNTRVFKSSWLQGAADGIGHQLSQQHKQFQADNPRALMLIRDSDIDMYLKSTRGKIRKLHIPNLQGSWTAYDQGYNVGKSISIDKGLDTATRGQLK